MSGTTGTVPLQQVIDDQLITPALWNGEFGNISGLLDAAGCGGHSDTDADAQIQTAPYPGSVLSKATSIAGELERLRYQLAAILGKTYWYQAPGESLSSGGIVPIGSVVDYPSATPANSNWHLADGTAVSRAVYADLFTLIGTTFGVGNGTTTFNLPDYRDRMSIGAGSSYAAGATGGEATHVLTIGEMPAHDHDYSDPGHYHRSTNGSFWQSASGTSHRDGTGSQTLAQDDKTQVESTGITLNSQGSGTAHNNLPPYLGMYKMMRVL